ncbi:MAG: hypothetical protein JRF52_06310 [Deltaproteobacteria bacterium]|jgi:rubrerythrin|nr:hypothetical protein [Deltaproteobacteria bacterium]MBW2203708.1 hypothetical protein [Deltaproteobacteria bacterium]
MIWRRGKECSSRYCCTGIDAATGEAVLEKAQNLEERAERYYCEAAEKMKALSEVARALKMLGKKHAAHLRELDALGA